ncbi:alpha/beta hydrolase family protein [Exiguobacterium undae]|uniref:alpha/beta hydrolase family protein n=1 Tax=Exiguobacterium undae TaxID=169177 RepID=UPI00047CEB6E|nr:alpha/beta fold hydrolase [Exiguobacterium undae]
MVVKNDYSIPKSDLTYFCINEDLNTEYKVYEKDGLFELFERTCNMLEEKLIFETKQKLVSLLPINNDLIYLVLDGDGLENNKLYSYNKKELKYLGISDVYFPLLDVNKEFMYFSSLRTNRQFFDTYSINLKNFEKKCIHIGVDYPTHIYGLNSNNEKIYFKHLNNSKAEAYLEKEGKLEPLIHSSNLHEYTIFDIEFISSNEVILSTNFESEYSYLGKINLKNNQLMKLVTLEKQNIRMLAPCKDQKKFLFSTTDGFTDRLFLFDLTTYTYEEITTNFPIIKGLFISDRYIYIMGNEIGGKTTLIKEEYETKNIAKLNKKLKDTKSLIKLSYTTKKYTDDTQCEMSIDTILYQPIKNSSKKVIIWIHGGPNHSQKEFAKEKHFQFLIDKGFNIVCTNYRGSSQSSKHFLNSGKKNWSVGAIQDIITGFNLVQTEYQFESPIVMGKSFGGYLALTLIFKYPSFAAKCIDICGPSNLINFIADSPPHWRKMLIDFIGDPESEYDRLLKDSPISQVHKMDIPLLLIHGENDPRVPVNQTISLESELKKQRKKVYSLYFQNEGHDFIKSENIQIYLKTIEEFINERL